MGTQVKDIVNIVITRDFRPISRQGFGTLLIVGPNATFADVTRIQFYTDLASIAADLTGGTSAPEYIAANAAFSQNPRPTTIAIGKKIVADADYTDALDGIFAVSKDFYGVVIDSRVLADQQALITWVQANERIAAVASAEAAIVDQDQGTDTTSIAYYNQNGSYSRAIVLYSGSAATKYPDAAFLGSILPLTPGSYTGAYRELSGESVDDITATQAKNVHDKNASTYEEIGGINVVTFSRVGNGLFIDQIVLEDWIKARMTEDVFALIAGALKVPYTDDGITAVANAMRPSLQNAQVSGGISPHSFDPVTKQRTGGFVIDQPLASSISVTDKTNRLLPDMRFTYWEAGAIHTVNPITGVIRI
jgi:hypothetical protein